MASPLDGGIIAILRGRTGEHLDRVVDTLAEAGVPSLEITLSTPGALPALGRAVRRWGDGTLIGAGTVRSVTDAQAATEAGARFLISPHSDSAIAGHAAASGQDYLPGAFTATEVVSAWAFGVTAVKLFPARLGGPRYLRDLREPLPDIPVVPTGGVSLDNVGEWFAAGAAAVGLGGSLVGDALEGGDLAALRDRADRLMAAVAEARR